MGDSRAGPLSGHYTKLRTSGSKQSGRRSIFLVQLQTAMLQRIAAEEWPWPRRNNVLDAGGRMVVQLSHQFRPHYEVRPPTTSLIWQKTRPGENSCSGLAAAGRW